MRPVFALLALAAASCASGVAAPPPTTSLSIVRATKLGARVGAGLPLTSLDLRLETARCAYRVAAGAVAMTVRSVQCDAPRSAVEGSATILSGLEPGVDLVIDANGDVVEDFRVLARAERRDLLLNLEVSDAIASVSVREDRVEARDRDGVVVLSSSPIVATDARGDAVRVLPTVTRLEANKYRLMLRVEGEGAVAPIVVDPAWSTLPSLGSARMRHSAVLLNNGKLLVVGGETMSGGALVGVTAVELFDPTTRAWKRVGTLRNALTRGYTVTTLADGDVLIAGGETSLNTSVSTVERYRTKDERMATAGEVANLPGPRALHGAVLLGDGKVLLFGGTHADTSFATTYLYDPTANTWSVKPSMAFARRDPAYVRLTSGDVLVAGGRRYALGDPTTDIAEVYDAAAGSWSSGGSIAVARSGGTLAPLPGSKALYYGGQAYVTFGAPLTDTMVYDRATKTWSSGGTPPKAHDQAPFVVLPDASLLIVGGRTNFSGIGNEIASVFDVSKLDPTDPSKAWTRSFLPVARVQHTLTDLASGNAFLVGGTTGGRSGLPCSTRCSTSPRRSAGSISARSARRDAHTRRPSSPTDAS